MDRSSSPTVTGLDLTREAESLIRSLAGVAHASVEAGPRGIDAVHVLADDDDAALSMARHVRSALLAGMATPILPARIHVRVRDVERQDDPAHDDHVRGDRPAHRIRLLDHRLDRDPEPVDTRAPGTDATAVATPDDDTAAATTIRPRLVAVDIDRPGDGRVRCRVTIAHGTAVRSADAVAVDLPGAAAQAAAQAAVRALIDAGVHGLELNGLREVEIAGRDYVLVALRRADSSIRHRAGSAPIADAPERAAAEAVVAAAREVV